MNALVDTMNAYNASYQNTVAQKQQRQAKKYQNRLQQIMAGPNSPTGTVGTPGILPNNPLAGNAPSPAPQQAQQAPVSAPQPQTQGQMGNAPQNNNLVQAQQLAIANGDVQTANSLQKMIENQQKQTALGQTQDRQGLETLYMMGQRIMSGQMDLEFAKQQLIQGGADPQEIAGITMQNLPQHMASIEAKLGNSGNMVLNDKQSVFNPLSGQAIYDNRGNQTVADGAALVDKSGSVLYDNKKEFAPEGPTADMQNYQAAQASGYQGSFAEYQKELKMAGRSSISVNTGAGKMGPLSTDEKKALGFEPDAIIQRKKDGSLDIVRESKKAEYTRVKYGNKSLDRTTNRVIEDIDRSLEMVDAWTTGAGSYLSPVKGTPQFTLSRMLDSIKAYIGFDELNKMRERSKTGGALGQVTEKEIDFLQALQGTLDQGLPPDELKYNLERVSKDLKAIKAERAQSLADQYSDFREPQAAPDDARFKQDDNGAIVWTGE